METVDLDCILYMEGYFVNLMSAVWGEGGGAIEGRRAVFSAWTVLSNMILVSG
jgi:hypothetical protein